MSLLLLAWRNFQQRALASVLTTISLALGVGLTVLVLAIYGLMTEAFQRNASVGYNLIVGAKGSPLQLTLNTVYYLSQPIENVPYSYMMEFFTEEQRRSEIERIEGASNKEVKNGKFGSFMQGGLVIPVCLGDYFGEFRVVGTTPDMFDKLNWGPDVDRPYRFSAGRNFVTLSEEHGYFEAVVGARVAREMKVGLGDKIFPKHGDPEGHGHDLGFTIVGVLEPTGGPNDRGAFVNIEGFYLMDGHARPEEDENGKPREPEKKADAVTEGSAAGDHAEGATDQATRKFRPLPIAQREVTAFLIRPVQSQFSIYMQRAINKGSQAQAAAPIGEITKMMKLIIEPINWVLLAITTLTCVVAAVGILVSIYNSMNDRRRDIAVMRALGASQETVMWVILLESALIAVLGGLLGWVIAHLAIGAFSWAIEDRIGIVVGFFTFTQTELFVIPIVLGLAMLAGMVPALMAYRTDVGRNLHA